MPKSASAVREEVFPGFESRFGPGPGLVFERYFSTPGVHPYDEIEWEVRTASISNDRGEVVFEQQNVEVPASWSQLATNVVASKYFKGGLDQPGREHSIRQLVDRVVKTTARWGATGGYFADEASREVYEAELTHLLVNQYACFNSPVWFNMGVEPGSRPQVSACFINSVDDSMSSILDLAKTEGMLFKYGSGTGTNLSTLRGCEERLSSGGQASGPVSFMKGFDAFANVIKSGGKTRRAAKMVILDVDHPDIVDFIKSKAEEEKKAWALIDAGYDGSVNGEAYSSVYFQNGNHSVRVSNEFMRAVVDDGRWQTIGRTSGEVMDTYGAREMMRMISDAAHQCGDPGLQFDTTINDWHTCAGSDRIYASNPCSEYMFLNDTACNLASLDLLKFRDVDGEFDAPSFRRAVRTIFTAQEIFVDSASYPTEKIEENSHLYRPIGLGYANLGALLMARGLPYDSDGGRAHAAAVTAIMCGEAYRTSAEISMRHGGPFPEYEKNAESFLKVMVKHRAAVESIDGNLVPGNLLDASRNVWDEAIEIGREHGFRNAQATVLAPTGTIAFMMDCDTTGVEPDIALVKYKKLVGGGMLKIVNRTVPEALSRLGYEKADIDDIIDYVDSEETIEGAPHLKDEHLPVFDCAFQAQKGSRSIHYMGHIRMMSAIQPFISGAISKTVNLPSKATVKDVRDAYVEAWRLGLKAIAIYRDGSKRIQPLGTSKEERAEARTSNQKPVRRKLPAERQSLTHKFRVGDHKGYLTVGFYDDERPGEIFVTMAKEGSTVRGLMDTVATLVSICLQYGVPLEDLVHKFEYVKFEPQGVTDTQGIRFAHSIVDYIFRWLGRKYLAPAEPPETVEGEEEPAKGNGGNGNKGGNGGTKPQATNLPQRLGLAVRLQSDAPACSECGSIMVRNGSCYKCLNCGTTSGCS
ncbi:MAG: vitamin B12-dependent ribonucleotide reductase [Planctomycetota bacterium]|jgi:ribonucleoside-diphosphate reductase alpha chain